MTGEQRTASGEQQRTGTTRTPRFPLAARCSLLAVIALTACAHNPPPPPPTPPTMVPRAAVDAMCSRMHAEGINTELRALKTTRPLITPQALEALGSAMFYSGHAKASINAAESVPVDTAGSCVGRAIDSVTPNDSDVMVLEFSPPLVNPFQHSQLGVFARVSLGNEAPTWYWVAIGGQGGTWAAASPIMISVRE